MLDLGKWKIFLKRDVCEDTLQFIRDSKEEESIWIVIKRRINFEFNIFPRSARVGVSNAFEVVV